MTARLSQGEGEMEEKRPQERKASCKCDNLSVTAKSEPLDVYICSCLDCQKLTGSSFTYCAIYPEKNVSIAGAKTWRYHADSGRWIEVMFCAICSCLVCYRMEASPETVLVSVGCFADPDFPKPETFFFASRRHRWLEIPDNVVAMDAQRE